MKLYVGNLPYNTTEDDLRQLFAQAGEVKDVVLIMDRETRQVARLRVAGYSMNEIGRALSKSPRLIYFRYWREVQKAVKKVLGSPAISSLRRSGNPR